MATVAYRIVSTYNSEEDRERLEVETGQRAAEADIADPWLTENPFGTSRRIVNAPKFTPATVQYDPWVTETPGAGPSRTEDSSKSQDEESENVAGWYRSLARKAGKPPIDTPLSQDEGNRKSRTVTSSIRSDEQAQKKKVGSDKKDWFISRALASQEAYSAESSGRSTPSSLADILSRDPPPLPTQRPFTPPVWLTIGPGNKGFEMLTRSGWEEGEALGGQKRAGRRTGLGFKEKELEEDVKKEPEVIDVDETQIIDLTISDSEDEYDEGSLFGKEPSTQPDELQMEDAQEDDNSSETDPNRLALLTPLPTVLKSDRLGIGLKAKTFTARPGTYRESVKRVTHSQAAIAAHIHHNDELRRMKLRHGRGKKGFERMKKRDEEKRRSVLAYLNAD